MKTLSKKVTIFRKTDNSEYYKINAQVLGSGNNKIGSSVNAVKAILSNVVEQKTIMPQILGISPDSYNWNERLKRYWDSITIFVPENGKELEIGFNYDLNNPDFAKNIQSFKGADGKTKTFSNDDQFAEYVENFIPEHEKYKYATPISPEDYMLWRYCLNYRDVANSPEEASKSVKIRFYIFDRNIVKRKEDELFEQRTKAGEYYYSIVGDDDKVSKHLYYLGLGTQLHRTDKKDRAKLLENIFQTNPKGFLSAKSDSKFKDKAFIEEAISKGILRRLPHSEMIVNSSDNTEIGSNMDDAIVFLKSEQNKKVLNEIEGRLRSLPKD